MNVDLSLVGFGLPIDPETMSKQIVRKDTSQKKSNITICNYTLYDCDNCLQK